jgi:hypothetical protein
MGGKSSRSKGQRGEREAIAILQPVINEVFTAAGIEPPELKRNLMQTMNGGYDVVGMEWLALEIKRQEKANVKAWWKQTLDQTQDGQTPVLMYRPNRSKWRIMMPATLIDGVQAAVDIDLDSFLLYFKKRIERELLIMYPNWGDHHV